jgi:hypothetical protein
MPGSVLPASVPGSVLPASVPGSVLPQAGLLSAELLPEMLRIVPLLHEPRPAALLPEVLRVLHPLLPDDLRSQLPDHLLQRLLLQAVPGKLSGSAPQADGM